MGKVDRRFVERLAEQARQELRLAQDQHEKDTEFINSVGYEKQRSRVSDLIFKRIAAFDDEKHQPPSVAPYRLIWECKHEIEDLDAPLRREAAYLTLKGRLEELNLQLAEEEK